MSDLKTNLQEILQEKQDKIIPENIKKDVQIFDITGTYEGSGSSTTGVKLFETEEEMRADSTAQEGDLAVVYGNKFDSVHNGTIVNTVAFPKQVVLSSAISSTINGLFTYDEDFPEAMEPERWQFTVQLTSTQYKVWRDIDDTTIVEYTSTDGTTYTRITELENDEYTFDLINRWYAKWNDTILDNFCETVSTYFGGLFRYSTERNDNYLETYSNVVITRYNNYTTDIVPLELTKIKQIVDKMYDEDKISKLYTLINDNGNIALYKYADGGIPGVIVAGSDYYRVSQDYTSSPKTSVDKYVLDLDNMTYTKTTLQALSSKYQYQIVYENIPTSSHIGIINFGTYGNTLEMFGSTTDTDGLNTNRVDLSMQYAEVTEYYYAPTQLTLDNANQLLQGISGYGKGVFTGDGSIWDNMTYLDKLKRIYNQSDLTSDGDYVLPLNYNYNRAGSSTSLVSKNYLVPIKLSEYNPDSANAKISLYKTILDYNDIYTLDKTKIIHQDKENSQLQIFDANTKQLLHTYTDIIIDRNGYGNAYGLFLLLSNTDVIFYSNTTITLYIYKLNLENYTITKTEITPGGERNDYSPFQVIAYNKALKKLYIGIKLDTVKDSTAKYEIGYVNTDTLEYTSILSKVINYNSTAYLLSACMTTKGKIFVHFYTYSNHYYYYLIDSDDTVLVQKEDVSIDTDDYSGSTYPTCNILIYEDDNYIYTSDSTRVSKSTLAESAYSSNYPHYYDFDMTFGYDNNIVYSIYPFARINELTNYYIASIYDKNSILHTYVGITKVDNQYKYIARYNNFILDNTYNYVESTLADYDILLIHPSIADRNTSSNRNYNQFSYIDNRKTDSYDGTITPQEYNTALSTSEQILGEEEMVNE